MAKIKIQKVRSTIKSPKARYPRHGRESETLGKSY